MNNKSLVYLWFKKDQWDCFKNVGINFDPRYNFSFDDEKRELTKTDTNQINIFKDKVISNITALIGDNGVGKTTILDKIYDLKSFSIPRAHENGDTNYNDWHGYNKTLNEYIAVLLIDEELYVINNTSDCILYNDHYCNPFSIKEKNLFDDITRIFITSSYIHNISNIIKSHTYHNYVFLNPRIIAEYGVEFIHLKAPFNPKQDIVTDYICDSVSKSFNFDKHIKINYLCSKSKQSKNLKNIKLSFIGLTRILEFDILNHKNDNLYPELKRVADNNDLLTPDNNIFHLLDIVKANLIDELSIYRPFILEEPTKISSAYEMVIKVIYEMEECALKEYFQNALEEIDVLFESIHEIKGNLLPEKDLARKEYAIIQEDKLLHLFEMINNNNKSFVFKYLDFQVGFSDGENSRLFFESSFFFLRNISKFINKKDFRINHNAIVLIDELDTSLHPEGKRTYINNLIKVANESLRNKNVQIIFTSHSPIVLSDIPSPNVVYIKNNNGDRVIFNDTSKKTFGNNIFSLYNDSFFFKNGVLMGDFAKNYLNNTFDMIANRKYNNAEEILKIIELVGEPLISSQMLNELKKVEGESFGEKEKIEKIVDEVNKDPKLKKELLKRIK